MLLHHGLVVADGLLVLISQHKEYVSQVQLPYFVVSAKLGTLSEQLLHGSIVLLVPVNFGLGHQDGNVLL